LHDTLEALTDRRAGNVNLLARYEMVSCDFSAHLDEVLRGYPELGDLCLRLNGGSCEVTAQSLRRVLYLGKTDTKLNSRIAVLLLGTVCHDLAIFHAQNRDRDVL